MGTRRAEKSTGTGKPGADIQADVRCGGSRTPPIFHEVVTPDGLSLSGCLLYPRCGRKSSVKSLRPASSCLPSLSTHLFLSVSFSLSLSVFLEPAEKGLLPIWLGGEIKRFTVHRTVNRLRARVRRFRPIYIDIYGRRNEKG